MTKKGYVVVEENWEYDDNYYSHVSGGKPIKIFTTKEEARKHAALLTVTDLRATHTWSWPKDSKTEPVIMLCHYANEESVWSIVNQKKINKFFSARGLKTFEDREDWEAEREVSVQINEVLNNLSDSEAITFVNAFIDIDLYSVYECDIAE